MGKVSLRGIGAHRFRLVSTMAAVLLGVSFMCGTAILGDTVRASFDDVFAEVYGRIDVVVRSDRQLGDGFGARRDRMDGVVLEQLSSVPGVMAAEGEVEGTLRILDSRGEPMYNPQAGPPALGLNWLEVGELNRWALVDGRPPAGPGEIVLDERSAADGGYQVGDEVGLVVRSGRVDARLVGIANYAGIESYSGSPAVLATTPVAQELVGEVGRFEWISVVAERGTDAAALAEEVDELGLEGVEVLTGESFVQERQDLFGEFVTLFTQLIGAFGLIALFVGAFIIYNTFTIIVAQRLRELALLRAVGATRRQVMGSVVTEAAMVGLAAAALGVVAGVGVAQLLRVLIEAFGFPLPDTALEVVPARFVLPVVLGLVITVAAALVPAWRAARTPPVAALRSAAMDRTRYVRLRVAVAAGFFVAAALLVARGLGMQSDLAVGVVVLAAVPAIVGLAVVGPVLVPPVVGVLGAPLPPVTGVSGTLARRNSVRNPARTSATACALVIGISLVCTVAVAAASLSSTVSRTVDRTTFGDLVVVGGGGGPGVPASVADELGDVPGVALATGVRAGPVSIEGRSHFALAVDPVAVGSVVDLEVTEGSLERLGRGAIAVARVQAEADGLSLGDRVRVGFLTTGEHDMEVVALYDRALTRRGEYVMSHEAWDAKVPPALRSDWRVVVQAEQGASVDDVRGAVVEAVADLPTLEVLDVAQYRDRQTGQVVERISYLYALLGLALVIGLLGIVNTLLLSVHERTREIGLLRAVGAQRSQLGSAVLQEAGVIAALGAVTGVLLGVGLGWAMVQTLQFDEELVFAVPGWSLLAIGAGSCVAGVVAGLYPAWRAGRLEVLSAVAYE